MGLLISKCDDIEKARLTQPPTCDIYRDSPLRILGYAGHLGVCANLLHPRVVLAGQMIATTYIMGDVFQKSAYSAKKYEPETTIINKAADALLWQALASIIIPGFILNRTCCFTRAVLRKTAKGTCGPPQKYMHLIPCILSLLVIPLIMKPIDNCVDSIMENTYREWQKKDAEKLKAKVGSQEL